MIWLSVYAGVVFAAVMLALEGVLPCVFTSDDAVVERTQAIWFLFALMQPLNGAVFALDGILIGASDGRFLMWSMVVAFAVLGASSRSRRSSFDWGIVGVWAALVVLICVRLALMGWRFCRPPVARHGLGVSALERRSVRTSSTSRTASVTATTITAAPDEGSRDPIGSATGPATARRAG